MFEIVTEGEGALFRMTRDGEWMVFPMSPLLVKSVAELTDEKIHKLAKDRQQRWVADDWSIQGSDGSRGGRDKYERRLWLTIGKRTWHFDINEIEAVAELAQLVLADEGE